MIGDTGNPLSASAIAGLSACASEMVPYFWSSVCQPATAPGTMIDSAPSRGTAVRPRAASVSRVMSAPARPLALSPTSLWSLADQNSANMSPPGPVIIGSTKPRTAAAVTAALNAFPPRSRTASPAALASGWLVAMTPWGA